VLLHEPEEAAGVLGVVVGPKPFAVDVVRGVHDDGEWLGAYHYSKYPGSLFGFVEEHAAYLKETS